MGVFSSTKSLAVADLDNTLFRLSDLDNDTSSFADNAKTLESNINFAERIELLTRHEAMSYRDRLQKLRNDHDRRQREERIVRARDSVADKSKDFIVDKREQCRVTSPKIENVTNTPQHRENTNTPSELERSR